MEENLDLEEGRRMEALKAFAHRHRWGLFALAVAVAVGAGAGYGYYRHQSAQLLAASEAYGSAVEALQAGREGDARQALGDLIAEYEDTPYAAFGRVYRARLEYQDGQSEEALATLAPLAEADGEPDEVRHIAVEERARIQWDQGDPQAALDTLATLDGEAFLPSYFLLKGDLLAAQGDHEAAARVFREARQQPGSGPLEETIQSRLEQLPDASGTSEEKKRKTG
ncbi:MAG: YfgM family protein [Thiohalorhabdus sp.]|uniref:YfgM family protein n=1 Tax=Thiohalorhabdus sp. TaxID=3094134 RepID=UPI00397EE124